MKYKFFQIPAGDSIAAENELNAFVAQHRITHIDRHFVADAANSFILIPKLKLGNAVLEAPASRILEAGASRIWVPIYAPEGKPELGNPGKNLAR